MFWSNSSFRPEERCGNYSIYYEKQVGNFNVFTFDEKNWFVYFFVVKSCDLTEKNQFLSFITKNIDQLYLTFFFFNFSVLKTKCWIFKKRKSIWSPVLSVKLKQSDGINGFKIFEIFLDYNFERIEKRKIKERIISLHYIQLNFITVISGDSKSWSAIVQKLDSVE